MEAPVSGTRHNNGSQLYVSCNSGCHLYVKYFTDATVWRSVLLPSGVNPSHSISSQGEVAGGNNLTGKGSTLQAYEYHAGAWAYWNNKYVAPTPFPYCQHDISSGVQGYQYATENYGPVSQSQGGCAA